MLDKRQYLLNILLNTTCLEARPCLGGQPKPQKPVLAFESTFFTISLTLATNFSLFLRGLASQIQTRPPNLVGELPLFMTASGPAGVGAPGGVWCAAVLAVAR